MRKIILPLLSAGLLLMACNKKTETTENQDNGTDTVSATVTASDTATAKSDIALTIDGTFSGELPCADCEGISETLTLKGDGTYVKESVYKGDKAKGTEPVKVEGKYKVEGNRLSLEGITDGSSNLYEFEGTEKLHYLTADGKKAEGDLAEKYTLTVKK